MRPCSGAHIHGYHGYHTNGYRYGIESGIHGYVSSYPYTVFGFHAIPWYCNIVGTRTSPPLTSQSQWHLSPQPTPSLCFACVIECAPPRVFSDLHARSQSRLSPHSDTPHIRMHPDCRSIFALCLFCVGGFPLFLLSAVLL